MDGNRTTEAAPRVGGATELPAEDHGALTGPGPSASVPDDEAAPAAKPARKGKGE